MTDPSPHTPPRRSARQAIIWIVKIVVSVGLLVWVLSGADLGRLWLNARTASIPFLVAALGCYLLMVLLSAWRWGLLLGAQDIPVPFGRLTNSFLVATFFNNILPSNIGGDVVRIRDTSRAAGSKTLAATVVLLDRGIGLLGLVFVAALGSTVAAARSESLGPFGPGLLWGLLALGLLASAPPLLAPHLIAGLLRPFRAIHQEWVSERIERLTAALGRFRAAPTALAGCFLGAILVQGTLVMFYVSTAHALRIPISVAHLSVLIPLSFIVQMAPISVNGFGVREATFKLYFVQLGLAPESAIALSLVGAGLIMLFSLSGAVAYLIRRHHPEPAPYLGTSS